MESIKKIFGVISGLVSGAAIVMLFDAASNTLHPIPEYINRSDYKSLSEHAMTAPLSSQIVLVLGWAFAAVVSGFIATYVAQNGKPVYAYMCGLIFLCATVFQMVMIGYPLWMSLAAFLIWLPLSHVGYLIFIKRTKANL